MALSNGGYWGQWTAEAALHSGGVEELEWQRRMGAVRDRGGRGGGSSLASAGVRLLLLPPPVHGCPPYKLVQAQGQSRIYWDRGEGGGGRWEREREEKVSRENLIGGSHWFFSIKMCWLYYHVGSKPHAKLLVVFHPVLITDSERCLVFVFMG